MVLFCCCTDELALLFKLPGLAILMCLSLFFFSILGLISYKPMMFPKASWMLAFGKLSKYVIAKNTFQALNS